MTSNKHVEYFLDETEKHLLALKESYLNCCLWGAVYRGKLLSISIRELTKALLDDLNE